MSRLKNEIAVCLTLFVFLVSRDCCVALPHDATGLSSVCDSGISCSYSPTIFVKLTFFAVVYL